MKTFGKVWLSIGLLTIALGIGLLILSVATGTFRRDVPTYSMEESYNDIESLDINVEYGEITIVEGSEFNINAVNMIEGSLESYVSDGTWEIRQNQDNFVNLYGFKFPANQLAWWNNDIQPKITITIPQGFIAKDFKIDISAGSAEAEVIRAINGQFTVKAGILRIDQNEVSESAEYNVGTGGMIIDDMRVNNITVDCGVGDVRMSGIITGDDLIKCGVGNIEMNLSGNIDDYSYHVKSGIGRIKINEESYHNIDDQQIITNGAENNLQLECGIGNITVEID